MSCCEEHYQRGLDILTRIDKDNVEAIVNSFKDSPAPDLGRLAVELIMDRSFRDPGSI